MFLYNFLGVFILQQMFITIFGQYNPNFRILEFGSIVIAHSNCGLTFDNYYNYSIIKTVINPTSKHNHIASFYSEHCINHLFRTLHKSFIQNIASIKQPIIFLIIFDQSIVIIFFHAFNRSIL